MRKFPKLHLLLFVLTFFSTLAAGAFQQGINILKQPSRIMEGFPFAATLICILLLHELSHYLAARKHHTAATLPFFIPAPTLLGTFGAFIKMKSPIASRKALVDIGASGPLVGFVASIIACVVGISMSSFVSVPKTEGVLILGDSLLFSLLSKMILGITPDNSDVLLHPIAFAGWIGLFVTSLNLIPIGQLDGGHIAFAIFGERHKRLSIALIIVLATMGIFFWEGWAFWAALMLILGIKHPPVLYWEQPLDKRRRITALISLIVFIITFVPAPFNLT